MPSWLVTILGAVYTRIPPAARPPLKRAFRWGELRVSALASRRSVEQGQRVEFLDFEIAHLEPLRVPWTRPSRRAGRGACVMREPGYGAGCADGPAWRQASVSLRAWLLGGGTRRRGRQVRQRHRGRRHGGGAHVARQSRSDVIGQLVQGARWRLRRTGVVSRARDHHPAGHPQGVDQAGRSSRGDRPGSHRCHGGPGGARRRGGSDYCGGVEPPTHGVGVGCRAAPTSLCLWLSGPVG